MFTCKLNTFDGETALRKNKQETLGWHFYSYIRDNRKWAHHPVACNACSRNTEGDGFISLSPEAVTPWSVFQGGMEDVAGFYLCCGTPQVVLLQHRGWPRQKIEKYFRLNTNSDFSVRIFLLKSQKLSVLWDRHAYAWWIICFDLAGRRYLKQLIHFQANIELQTSAPVSIAESHKQLKESRNLCIYHHWKGLSSFFFHVLLLGDFLLKASHHVI